MTAVRRTLATKFAFLFGAFSLVVSAFVCLLTYASYRDSMLEHYGKYATGAGTLAASILDPDELMFYANTLKRDERYDILEKELDTIRKSLGVRYLYVQMPISDSEFIYLFDLYDPEEAGDADTFLGAKSDYDENFRTAKFAMSTGEPARALDITHSKYGYLASAYVPIAKKGGVPFAYVGVDISMDYILGFLMRYLAVIASATAVIMALCFTALFLLVRYSVVSPIRAIALKTREFTQRVRDEDFEKLQIPSNDEIGDLAASVNKMFGEIRDFTSRLAEETAVRERVQSELDMATTIQKGILPRTFPPYPDFPHAAIFASMTPAKEVGGDFYDFFAVDEHKLAVVIADVSGKGIPAALFMMVARTLIKNQAISGKAPHEVLETVNNQLCQNNETGMFVTAFVGILDAGRDVLSYANAGHNPPIVRRAGRWDWLPVKPGFVLAGVENIRFVTQEMEFQEEDVLLLYTDGVTEAMNEGQELFGNERLTGLLSATSRKTKSPKELIEAVSSEIKCFAGDAEQTDDITMLALCRIGE
ncbi:MAG: SpoIIE family protein phosphatase [Synergistaceae bacterium]|nr:SpoIIE family protein phosphatase [Synergistaceae bacterium]